jgi:hypothetical protein
MKRNTTYLQRFESIISELSSKHDLDEEEITDLVDYFFVTMNKFITDPRMPTIKISNFGTFKPSIGKLDWQMKNANYHLLQGKIAEDKLLSKIDTLQIIKDRLIRESNGDETWKEWKDKKIDNNAKK